VTLLNVARGLVPLPPLLAPIVLRQLPAAEEWELQNESYVSKAAFCEPVPTGVTGPGAVGMSNVLLSDDDDDVDVDVDVEDEDERKDEDASGAFGGGGCVDVAGGGFCGGAGAGVCGRLDVDGGEESTGADVDAGLDVGAVGKVVWGIGGKVESGADRSDVCTTAGV
jgi:hypothetical protein